MAHLTLLDTFLFRNLQTKWDCEIHSITLIQEGFKFAEITSTLSMYYTTNTTLKISHTVMLHKFMFNHVCFFVFGYIQMYSSKLNWNLNLKTKAMIILVSKPGLKNGENRILSTGYYQKICMLWYTCYTTFNKALCSVLFKTRYMGCGCGSAILISVTFPLFACRLCLWYVTAILLCMHIGNEHVCICECHPSLGPVCVLCGSMIRYLCTILHLAVCDLLHGSC